MGFDEGEDAEELGDAPGLGTGAAGLVGGVAHDAFGELGDAVLVDEVLGGGEDGVGDGPRGLAVEAEEGLGVEREGEGPAGAVVVGGLVAARTDSARALSSLRRPRVTA